ncbi:MAG: leucine-rich repeat domain-containing protein [Agathobacter sp.]|nr:leucine-rich repeat domain-containing protein [Agathobacter sp.]
MKKFLLTMMLVLCCLFMGRTDVALASEDVLSLNGKTQYGEIVTKDEDDYWKFTLNEAGCVSIEVKSYLKNFTCRFYDENLNQIKENGGKEANANVGYSTNTYTIHLKAGTYYFEINSYWHDYTGRYELKGSFVNANETYKEPADDNFANAPTIGFNSTVNGQIAYNDAFDTYKIVLPKSGKLTYVMTSYLKAYATGIYNEAGYNVWKSEHNEWNAAVGKITNTHEIELVAGTYYIKVAGARWIDDHEYDGNYSFNLKFTDAQETYPETVDKQNNEFVSASQISIGQKVRGHIAVNDEKDIYKVQVSKKSRLSVDVTTYVDEYRIIISNSDGRELYDREGYWDKTLGYKTNTHEIDLEAGTYYITISGRNGNYDLKASERVLLQDCDIKVNSSVVCTGKEVKVPMTIKYNGTTLKEGTDYITEYGNNINIGTNARVTITGIGKYADSVEKTFSIVVKVGATAQNDDYKFKFLSDSTVALSGLANNAITTIDLGSNVWIAGKWFDVTEVAEKAFYKKTKILSANLPWSITKVGKNAFNGCTKMTKITFHSAPRIYAGAFTNCGKLKTVEGLQNGTIITLSKNRYKVNGDNTLEFTNLENSKDTSLTVPSTVKIGAEAQKVTAISAKAVDKCAKLKTVVIGKYVTTIGDKAFEKCTALTKVTFKGKNITMGAEVFNGCKKLKTIEGGTGSVLTVGSYKYQITGKSTVAAAGLKSDKTKTVKIGTTVKVGAKSYKITSVAADAFRDKAITSVTLGSNVKKIGDYAFYSCDNLKKVTFKAKKLSVGKNAFYYCGNLRTLSGVTGSTFTYDANKYTITGKSSVTFAGVTSEYGNSVTIPDSVTIGAKSFKVTKIANKALRGKDMTSVTIGRNVTSIGTQAFEKCENLLNLYVQSTKIKAVGSNAFKNVDDDIRVRVPSSKLARYKEAFRIAGMPKTANYSNYYYY